MVFGLRRALNLGNRHAVGRRGIGHAWRQVVDDASALPVRSVEAETGVAQVDGADAHGARGAASCVLRRNGHTASPLAGRSAAVAASIIVVLQPAVVISTGPQAVSRLASRDAASHDLDLFDVVDAIGRLGVLRESRLAGQLGGRMETGTLTLGLMYRSRWRPSDEEVKAWLQNGQLRSLGALVDESTLLSRPFWLPLAECSCDAEPWAPAPGPVTVPAADDEGVDTVAGV